MVNHNIMELLPKSGIVLIIGRRGSGKSVMAHAIIEDLHLNRSVCLYNFPLGGKILPKYIKNTQSLNFENGSAVLIDEGYMNFSSRDSMSSRNKFIDNLNGLARQKDLLIIYITQESARIDINILRGTDVLIVKALSVNQVRFERKELKIYLSSVKDKIDKIKNLKSIKQSAYISCDLINKKFEGLIMNACTPPWYWNENISKAWAGIALMTKSSEVKNKGRSKNIETDELC